MEDIFHSISANGGQIALTAMAIKAGAAGMGFESKVSKLTEEWSRKMARSITWGSFWKAPISGWSFFISGALTSEKLYKMLIAIFGTPDFENSKYILY